MPACYHPSQPEFPRGGDRVGEPAHHTGTVHMAAIPLVALRGTAQLFPSLGFGVGTAWFKCANDRKQVLKAAVHAALDAGFTHIDEAEMYQNGMPHRARIPD